MNQDKQPSLKKPEILFLSFFGVGFLPKAPGTWGTLATLPFLYLLGRFNPPFFLFIPFLIILTAGSCFIAEHVQKKYEVHDPQWIVIDEVLGMSITWLFSLKFSLAHLMIQFVLFRFFDIVKVWPASFFDQKIHHGAGTILDDIVSGIYAGLIYLLIATLINF
jgi:phosphatidylglycerophosphatase A